MSLKWPVYPSGFLAQVACIWEATSRKPGNIHRFADFADTSYLDFLLSACAIRDAVERATELDVGLSIWGGTNDTRDLVRSNTNLGILLLTVPLAKAARFTFFENTIEAGFFNCRAGIQALLDSLTIRDASHVFECIRRINPGGLGDAPEQDVREEPTVTLLDAMKLAADRDMVARQYANGFADVFDFGVPAFADAFARFGCVEAAIIDSQLRWLATYPDSLIARKNGPAVAEDVRRRAAEVLRLGGIATPEGRAAGVALDKHLRSDGNRLNPGTTADLITACLFVALRENKVTPSAPFRWDVPDWL